MKYVQMTMDILNMLEDVGGVRKTLTFTEKIEAQKHRSYAGAMGCMKTEETGKNEGWNHSNNQVEPFCPFRIRCQSFCKSHKLSEPNG